MRRYALPGILVVIVLASIAWVVLYPSTPRFSEHRVHLKDGRTIVCVSDRIYDSTSCDWGRR